MLITIIILSVLAFIAVIVLITAYVCFRLVCYSKDRIPPGEDEYDLPEGDVYIPFHQRLIDWVKVKRSLPCEELEITSFDGLRLRGKYYKFFDDAIVEILIHGYRGNSERDLSAGLERCKRLGRNAVLVDLRGAGNSEGNVISFGINEHKDLLQWIDFLIEKLGRDVKIILTGISMGGSTVVMAAGKKLPENVVCVLADCGFSSAKAILYKVLTDMKLPPKLFYPFIRLGAILYGGFDLDNEPAIEAVTKATVPIIFIHGEDDDFVPCYMSRELFDECSAPKKLVTIKGAGHGLAYPTDKDAYVNALKDFANECGFQHFE